MPPVCLPREVYFRHVQLGGGPRSGWRDYIPIQAWECLRIPQSELVDVAVEKETETPATTQPQVSS